MILDVFIDERVFYDAPDPAIVKACERAGYEFVKRFPGAEFNTAKNTYRVTCEVRPPNSPDWMLL